MLESVVDVTVEYTYYSPNFFKEKLYDDIRSKETGYKKCKGILTDTKIVILPIECIQEERLVEKNKLISDDDIFEGILSFTLKFFDGSQHIVSLYSAGYTPSSDHFVYLVLPEDFALTGAKLGVLHNKKTLYSWAKEQTTDVLFGFRNKSEWKVEGKNARGNLLLQNVRQQRIIGEPVFYKGLAVGFNIVGEGNPTFDYGVSALKRPEFRGFTEEIFKEYKYHYNGISDFLNYNKADVVILK